MRVASFTSDGFILNMMSCALLQKLTWPQADASRRNLLLSLLESRLSELNAAMVPLQREDFDMDLGRVLVSTITSAPHHRLMSRDVAEREVA